MDIAEVRAEVARAFAASGGASRAWPNPHADGRPAKEEEYSRCLDPEKFRIVGDRVRAWVQVLTGLGVADSEVGGSSIRLKPRRPAAVPLVLELHPVEGVPDAHVVLRVGEPGWVLSRHPDCGCDACDWGSDDLLAHLDDEIAHVVSGDLVHVRVDGAVVRTTSEGWSAEGALASRTIDAVLADARAGRSKHPVIRGPAWF